MAYPPVGTAASDFDSGITSCTIFNATGARVCQFPQLKDASDLEEVPPPSVSLLDTVPGSQGSAPDGPSMPVFF